LTALASQVLRLLGGVQERSGYRATSSGRAGFVGRKVPEAQGRGLGRSRDTFDAETVQKTEPTDERNPLIALRYVDATCAGFLGIVGSQWDGAGFEPGQRHRYFLRAKSPCAGQDRRRGGDF